MDNSCPNMKIMSPFEVPDGDEEEEDSDPLKGYYSGTMHTRIVAQDETAIESIVITDAAGEQLGVFELAKGGKEIQVVDEVLDVCNYGTGEEKFTVTTTDSLGNSCAEVKAPYIIHCPQFISSEEYLTGKATPNHIESVDFNFKGDQDGLNDILVATSHGIMIFRNDGNGRLKEPETLPDLAGISAKFVHAVNLNNDALTDLIVTTGGKGHVNVYIQFDKVCLPDDTFVPSETDDPNMDYPTVCHHGFGLVQSIPMPAVIMTTHLANVSTDKTPLGGAQSLTDLIVATDKAEFSLGILVRSEGDIGWESPQVDEQGNPIKDETGEFIIEKHTASRCSYFTKRWNLEKEEREAPAHEQLVQCFSPPDWVAAAGGIVDLDTGDFMTTDQKGLLDIIAVWKNAVSIFKNDGENNYDIAFTQPLSGGLWNDPLPKLTRVIPGYFDPDDHLDALVVLSNRNQIWTIFGEGNGKWRHALNPDSGLAEPLRRATCVEGTLSDVALYFLDDFDTPQNQTLDIVVANKSHGTMWSLKGNGLPTDGTSFADPQILNVMPSPEQVLLTKIDGDAFVDAVFMSPSSKSIAVVHGSNHNVPKSNSKYGKKGTFVGSQNLTTLIPEQNFGGTLHCGSSAIKPFNKEDPYKEWVTWEGTPEKRLVPNYMALGDFVGPDTNIDLVLLTERTGVFEKIVQGSPKLGDPRTILYTYRSDGYAPTVYHGRTSVVSATSYCNDKLVPVPTDPNEAAEFDPEEAVNFECPAKAGPVKGLETGLIAGTVDQGLTLDLVVATDTLWQEGEDSPQLPTVDVLLNKFDGKFDQVEVFPSKNHSLTDNAPPGEWQDLGFVTCPKPRIIKTLYCDGPNDNLADFAVICQEKLPGSETSAPAIKIYQSLGSGDKYNVKNLYFHTGAKTLLPVRLGNQFGPDLFEDLLLMTDTDVLTFENTGFCNFKPTVTEVTMGPGLVSMGTGDLNDDGFADLVTPLKNGNIAVAMGFNAVGFEAPSHSLETGSTNLGLTEVADINGDGALDILVVDQSGDGILSFMNIGDGSFWPKAYRLRTGVAPTDLKLADFNQDDCLDIATLSPGSKAASILISRVGESGDCIPQL